jgi:hypothetical protein
MTWSSQDPNDFPSRVLLCLGLYQRLRKVASDGTVIVANEGEHMTGNVMWDAQGRPRWIVASWGESYRINCPFCNDTRRRLWVNYRFGQFDPVNLHNLATHYGICFNEDCLIHAENRARLIDEIYGVHNRRDHTPFDIVTTGDVNRTQRLGVRKLPGECRPLTTMGVEEYPIQYLTDTRRFGFETAEEYGLTYCVKCDEHPAAVGRIIAPIVQNGINVGWQGRYVGTPPNKYTAKYYTCPGMPKRLVLYNIDRAKGKPFVVVFEGITDVWRLPNYSVAMLGKSLAAEQMGLLQVTFCNGEPIVICVDPDAYDNCAMKIHEMVSQGRNPVVRVRLPEGYDPADLDSDVLLSTILSQTIDAGVRIHI